MAPSRSMCPLVVIKIIHFLKQKLKYMSILSVSSAVIEVFYLKKKKKNFRIIVSFLSAKVSYSTILFQGPV